MDEVSVNQELEVIVKIQKIVLGRSYGVDQEECRGFSR